MIDEFCEVDADNPDQDGPGFVAFRKKFSFSTFHLEILQILENLTDWVDSLTVASVRVYIIKAGDFKLNADVSCLHWHSWSMKVQNIMPIQTIDDKIIY